jgi:hypothetical protein
MREELPRDLLLDASNARLMTFTLHDPNGIPEEMNMGGMAHEEKHSQRIPPGVTLVTENLGT